MKVTVYDANGNEEQIEVQVGGTPSGEGKVACSCSFRGRCPDHAAKMKLLAELYWARDPRAVRATNRYCRYADGYGEEGFVPDWSGVRDSSPYAVDRMYAEATKR